MDISAHVFSCFLQHDALPFSLKPDIFLNLIQSSLNLARTSRCVVFKNVCCLQNVFRPKQCVRPQKPPAKGKMFKNSGHCVGVDVKSGRRDFTAWLVHCFFKSTQPGRLLAHLKHLLFSGCTAGFLTSLLAKCCGAAKRKRNLLLAAQKDSSGIETHIPVEKLQQET